MDVSKRDESSINPVTAEENKDSTDILKLISEFIIAQDIITLTNDWRNNFLRSRLEDTKFKFIFFRSALLKIIASLIIISLFMLIAGKYRQSNNVKMEELNEKKSPVEKTQDSEDNETEIEIKDESMAEINNHRKSNIQQDPDNGKKQTSRYLMTAIASMPSPVFIRTRNGTENSLSERIFAMYQNENLEALIAVRHELSKKSVRSEYIEDLIGRLYIKKGNIDKAIEIYNDLCQTDSPNVEEYEYMLLIAYFAGQSKHNFLRLKEYISSDTLHPYSSHAGSLFLSN
jgi:tetratricopeptide (TPR) repeat protein